MYNVLLLGLASFFTDVASEMVYPLLPLYLSTRLGATPFIIGLIEGVAESLASLLRVFSGFWSDRLGSRKPIAIAGYGSSAVGKLFLYVSTTWPLVFIGRLVDRFGKGVRSAPRDALIADSIDPLRRGNAFGLHRALDSAGATLGVVLAYLLFTSSQRDYGSVFLLSLAPALVGVIVLFFVRERRGASPKQHPGLRALVRQWGSLDTRLKAFILLVFIFNLGNSSNQFLLLRATNLGVSAENAILLYLAYNACYALISWPAGRLSDRIGRKTLLVAGYAAYGLLYIGFGLASAAVLLPLFLVYGAYIAMTDGVEKALVSDLAPKDLRATLIGLHATAAGIGLLPASLFAGFLWDTFGAPAPFYFGGALGLLAAAGLAFVI